MMMCWTMYTHDEEKKEWYDNDMIAHACGGIDSADYTNSKEALESALNNNIKLAINAILELYLSKIHL